MSIFNVAFQLAGSVVLVLFGVVVWRYVFPQAPGWLAWPAIVLLPVAVQVAVFLGTAVIYRRMYYDPPVDDDRAPESENRPNKT